MPKVNENVVDFFRRPAGCPDRLVVGTARKHANGWKFYPRTTSH